MDCRADGCERDAVCKGLCDKHYRRLLFRGSHEDSGSKMVSSGDEMQRFNDKYKVDKSTGCWNWIAGTRPNGKGTPYGRHHRDDGSAISSHRFSYIKHVGSIPQGKYVCHKCDNTLCVNPEHLFIGSHKDNMRDMVEKGRSCKARGESKFWRSKLTNDQALSVLNSSGTYREIASKFGVSASVVGRIKRGESYL